MPPRPRRPTVLTGAQARHIWLHAQRLDSTAPFGGDADATQAAIRHLGYVQIDTINVIERCHHHILWSRIPDYRREHLQRAQSHTKTVFEYWTHALSYVPTQDLRFFRAAMKRHRQTPRHWFGTVSAGEVRKLLRRIHDDGPLTIRDIDDDVLVDKDHPWASRKPSKRALQMAFYAGDLTVSARAGMLKTYELMDRHFGWDKPPRAASEAEIASYLLDRSLRAQGLVSLDSICHLDASRKPAMRAVIESRLKRKRLVPVAVESMGKIEHWAEPDTLGAEAPAPEGAVHLLSPFDPLIIQRKRLKLFFGYEHRFEAYVPKEKRLFGYFALPVLVDDAIVAVIDIKTDRAGQALRIQQWTWIGTGAPALHKARIEEILHRFERFQLRGPLEESAAEPQAPG